MKFRGDSGLQDGNTTQAGLLGGFYDSGNNIKFSFPTAYTVTLLSWSVLEYHEKYADIGELHHARDIIRWGSDYLLKLFIPPNAASDPILYSQARPKHFPSVIPTLICGTQSKCCSSFFIGWRCQE